MFFMILRNIKRHRYTSMMTAAICLFLVALLNLYFGNISENERQLSDLAKITSIQCKVTNLNGSRSSGLVISEEATDKILASPYVKDKKYTLRMMAGIGEFSIEEWESRLTLFAMGANEAAANVGFTSENVKMEIAEQEAFFASSDPVCIVSDKLMEKEGWKVGDIVPINFYYYDYSDPRLVHCFPLEVVDLKISGEMDSGISGSEQMPIDIMVPIETMRVRYHRNQKTFSVDSMGFYATDPLKINELKNEMKEIGFMDKIPAAEDAYQGNALTVNDTVFRSIASQLRQSIDILYAFFPLILITICIIGYITSFLLIGSRQKEFALMRGLGVSALRGVWLLFFEQMILVLLGVIIGSVAALLMRQEYMVVMKVNLIVFAGYLMGSLVALVRIGKRTTMRLLFEEE